MPAKSQMERVNTPSKLTYKKQINNIGRFAGAYLGKAYVGCYYQEELGGSEIGVNLFDGLMDPLGYKMWTVATEKEARQFLEKKTEQWLRKNGLTLVAEKKHTETPSLEDWIIPKQDRRS